VTLQITLLNIYCTLILSLWFRNLSGCKIDVYSVHRCGSESYTCVLHIADWITFVFWNLKQRTTLKTISFGVAWSQNPCGSRRLELIPRFMMPGFRLFKATLKLGMRQGSEGQTRAQRQGDFMDKSNNYLLYTVSVAMISKFVRLQNWSYSVDYTVLRICMSSVDPTGSQNSVFLNPETRDLKTIFWAGH
jgi:hypothetical protein